ncbi:MAG: hypothetical protein AAGE43_12990 [Pseudomonadota bacterium]
MSSPLDLDALDTDFRELVDELLDTDESQPEAFYLALKQALVQLEHHDPASFAA